ncbi:MAG: SHOCT domain-containing protein [Oscillospiraceae bacterium]|nr:SHOCT domain-containing protein [Oscillospiraceae bacterium]
MRAEILQIIADYEIKTFGSQKALEIADEKIPTSEKLIYIGPSNITITPRNTNAPQIRTGVIAITDRNIYVVHKALWESGFDVFPIKNLELVSYKATGLTGATFNLTLTNVSITFLGGYKKEYAEKLNLLLSALISNDTSTEKETNSSEPISAADEIKKFKDLLDSGIISQEEFNAKKKQLLGL